MKINIYRLVQACVLAVITILTATAAGAQYNTPHQKPQRIRLARGVYSKTTRVSFNANRLRSPYILRTRAGRTMSIRIIAAKDSEGLYPVIIVTSPSGKSSALQNPKAQRFDTRYTESGDYLISIGSNLMAATKTEGTALLNIWIR